MPPRRKTRKAAALEGDDGDNASPRSTPPPASLPLSNSLLHDVNIASLSSFFPEAILETPTPALVVQCYKLILNQAEQLEERSRNLEELQAESERKEIEIDQALQDRDNAVRELETNIEIVRTELDKTKAERDELAESRASLRSELSSITRSQASSSQEVAELKAKIEEVEKEKRDLLGVVSRLEEDVAERDEEITNLRESLKASRKEAQELESSVRDIRATERSTAFKVETLSHQLQLAKDENERTNSELSKKTEEYSLYRRDKHTEIVKLQSELDTLKQTHNQTTNTLRALQSSHSSQSHQLSQSLQKVQDLTSQLADQDAKYSSEAASLRRLVRMLEERENQAKELVAGIERDWEGLGEKAAASEQKLREALEEEQQRTKELESELEDLRTVLEQVNRGALPVPVVSSASATAVPSDSLYELSPGLAMVNRMQKSGKSFTEVYSEYVKMQGELATKALEIDRLDRTLTDVLNELEERAPALAQQKVDLERAQAESQQLAAQLSQALSDREASLVRARESEQSYASLEKVNRLLEKQLADLGAQLKSVLKELGRLHEPTLPPDEDMQNVSPPQNIDQVITNSLVLYRSIPELQEQNQKLLRCIRELGERMEAEEKDYKEKLDQEQNEAIVEAHNAMQVLSTQLENERKASQLKLDAISKERDTLRTMLVRYERSGPQAQMSEGSTLQTVNGLSHEPSDLEKELEEVKDNFEMYRKEMGIDTVKLREEVAQYQKETNQLNAALAKANAKIEYLNERYRMAQDQYAMYEGDNQNLQKRNQQLQDQYTRLEISCNHATEELSNANIQIERLRNECFNLRAEKKIWENVQGRLLEENKLLSVERSRMADLIGNVQKMHNDIDNANESDRRRLESQIQTLENQAQDLRLQLSRERDTLRQTTLTKDIELQELRTKVDRSTEASSKAREALVEAETSRKHLQSRVDDLVKQIQMSEEKLAVYERRTTTSGISTPQIPATDNASSDEQHMLKSEVAELRAALKAAQVDLSAAQGHVQQFQEISRASEGALESLSSVHEEYKASTEAQIAKLESQQKTLNDEISSLKGELEAAKTKNDELQQTLEKERASFVQDKKILEDTIVEITNAEMSSRSDQALRESAVREQQERAKTAEEKYTREVVAHAEAIKLVDTLKNDLSEARATIREKTLEAETARANLSASTGSWKQQREALDKEIAGLNDRCKDLTAQNATLHQHLESVSSQASRIRQAADSAINVPVSGEAEESDARMAELRSVVAYLRKEKEIVDLQLELSKQENARLRTQIDHLSQNLEETRNTLSLEREEAAKSVENSSEHSELLERINQLNILRESNATLRAESDANVRKTRQLEAKLNELQTEVGPLKEEVTTLRAEVEAKDRQIQRLEDENRQWKERNSQLLTKYDRTDPNDIQALKDEIDDLQIDLRRAGEERESMTKEIETQTKKAEEVQTMLQNLRTKHQGLLTDSRKRLGELNGQKAKLNETIAELEKQLKEVTAERDRLTNQAGQTAATANSAEVEALKNQLSALTREKELAAKTLSEEVEKSAKLVVQHNQALASLRAERDKLIADKQGAESGGSSDESTQLRQRIEKLEAENAELTKARDEALTKLKTIEERAAKAEEEAQGIRLQNEKFQARLKENEKRRLADSEKLTALTEKLKQEQEQAVNAATEKLRAELQTSSADVATITKRHAEELRALETKLVSKHEEEIKAAIEKARGEVQKPGPVTATGSGISQEDHEQAIKAATERGRIESAAKIRLKDSMLMKAQANVKHLEAQIKAWREAGIVPNDAPLIPPQVVPTPVKTTPSAAAATSSKPAGSPVVASTTPTTAAPAPTPAVTSKPAVVPPSGPAAASSALPKKPTLNTNTAPAATGPPHVPATVGRGRGRGAMRGGRGGPLRLGVPAAIAHAAASNANADAAGSVSIIGAAGKRTREENEVDPSSLAKRIKPADGAGKPVALRRDRVAPVSTSTPPS